MLQILIANLLTLLPIAVPASQSVVRCKLTRDYLTPVRIVQETGDVKDSGNFLGTENSLIMSGNTGQAMVNTKGCALMRSGGGEHASVLLDFGRELHGGLRITTGMSPGGAAKVRITLGESVSEALSEIEPGGATNDHAIRDFEAVLPWIGVREFGNSGFRFARLELLDTAKVLAVREINAIEVGSDYPQIGSFSCSDRTLNRIWEVGRHTVKCNMQDYLWDGIKRDRLVWLGDMYPEVMSILGTYGAVDVVTRSLDFATQDYELPSWINGMSSYSLWWILIQARWYEYSGDMTYLGSCRDYLFGLLKLLSENVNGEGRETLEGGRFLDWPSEADRQAVDTGLHALMLLAFRNGAELCTVLGNPELAALCRNCHARLSSKSGEIASSFFASGISMTSPGRKQAVALMKLASMISPDRAASALLDGGCHGFSTFYGYFMLEALAESGSYDEAMDLMKEFWGGMLELGATSFWEDFDIDWMKNAGRIDELPVEGKVDVHKQYGGYCYKSYRHSLCHGWASGPTAWLSNHVLGLSPLKPGMRVISVDPHLGKLGWAEGSWPVPGGEVRVKVTKLEDGSVSVEAKVPAGVRLVAPKGVRLAVQAF